MLILFVLIFFSSTTNAHAYIDPGGGSYFMQYLIAGVLGSLYLVRNKLFVIKSFLLNIIKTLIVKKQSPKDGQE